MLLKRANCTEGMIGRERNGLLKILALTRYGLLGASSRMRTYQYLPGLLKEGIDVQVLPLLRDAYLHRLYSHEDTNWRWVVSDYLSRASHLLRARKYDLLWIEKELFPNLPGVAEKALQACGIPYVADYDDAIYHNYDLSRNWAKRVLKQKIGKIMKNAALVICGNEYLAEHAHSAGASHVEIIPTVVDLSRYSLKEAAPSECKIVGWIGMPATVRYLEHVAPALKALSKERPLQLRVIGTQFSCFGVNTDCRPWTKQSEVGDIQDFDIGIMPLADSPWEHGKCAYKLIQYMACGKPVIASPVGMNRRIVQPGVNGYLASDTEEWIASLRSLLADADLRRRMGTEGRAVVEQKYSLQVTTPRLAQLFRQLSHRKSV